MITDQIKKLLIHAAESALKEGDLNIDPSAIEINLEMPPNKEFGDYATNLALTLSRSAAKKPREIARILIRHIDDKESILERVEIAGPGFMNFYLKPDWLHDTLLRVENEDSTFGFNNSRAGEKTLIEFVSANPTGPISVVNGRAAALGDSLGNLLSASGAEVAREFYVNDALNSKQLDLMGASLAARYLQQLGHAEAEVPEDGYQGEYLVEIAADIVKEYGNQFEKTSKQERSQNFRDFAVTRMIAQQEKDLKAFGVIYDKWFYESSLYEFGSVRKAIDRMKELGFAYEKDGALWLKTTELAGDDQDRVLVRSNDRETYVAADAAYHANKYERGYNRLIDIWGADHHGYVARLKASVAALGHDPASCEIILTQMVMLVRDGEPVRGSKRAGDIIPLQDLVEEVGRDAARYYCMLNSYETTATFDLELAKKQSSDNPVFYAQYAHARCCNVLNKASEMHVAIPSAATVNLSVLVHEKELELLRKLADYPAEVRIATDMLAPHRLTACMREIGQALHQFYEECPALKDGVPDDLRDARLIVFNSTRIVVRNLLALLGVRAPERM